MHFCFVSKLSEFFISLDFSYNLHDLFFADRSLRVALPVKFIVSSLLQLVCPIFKVVKIPAPVTLS